MGIINGEPNRSTSDSNSNEGARGPPGFSFKTDQHGNYDVENKKFVNLSEGQESGDSISFHQFVQGLFTKPNKTDVLLLPGTNKMVGDLDLNGNRFKNPSEIDMDRKKILNLDTDDNDLTAVNNITMKNSIKTETNSHLKRDALGDVDMKGHFIGNLHDSDAETADATNIRSDKILLAGTRGNIGKLQTSVDLNNNKIVNVGAPVNESDSATKGYVDSQSSSIDLSEPLDSDLNMGGNLITFLKEPTQDNEAATKSYIDVGLAEKVNKSELFTLSTKNYVDSELVKKLDIT